MASVHGIENSVAAFLLDDDRLGSQGSSGSRGSLKMLNEKFSNGHDVETGPRDVSIMSTSTNQEELKFGSYDVSLITDKGTTATGSRSANSNSTGSRLSSYKNSFGSSTGTADRLSSFSRRGPPTVNVVLDTQNGEVSELGEDLVRKLQRTTSRNSFHNLAKTTEENLKSAASVMQGKSMGYGLGPTGARGGSSVLSGTSKYVLHLIFFRCLLL